MNGQPVLVVGGHELAFGVQLILSEAGYEAKTANTARDAIGAMASTSFSGVVLESKLRDLDGLALVRHLRAKQIQVPVMLITQGLSPDQRRQVSDLKAGILLRPFRHDQLLSAMRRLLKPEGEDVPAPVKPQATEESTFREAFRQRAAAFGEDGEFPVLDKRLARAHEMLVNPDVSAAEMTLLIQDDPRVVAAILRLVNSPVHGPCETINDLQQATARLGMMEVVGLIMQASLQRTFAMDSEPFASMAVSSWRRNVAAAKLATSVRISGYRPKQVYPAVLLQDVGELIGYGIAAQATLDTGVSRHDAREWTTSEVETAHTRLGARLLRAWNLPHPIPQLAGHHHDSQGSRDPLTKLSREACSFVEHVLNETPYRSVRFCRTEEEREALADQVRSWVASLY